MKERLTPNSRKTKAGVLASVGAAAALLAGCSTGHSGEAANTTPPKPAKEAIAARDAIAGMYSSCAVTEVQKAETPKTGQFTSQMGYEALRLSLQVTVNQDAQQAMDEYAHDSAVQWGDKRVIRLGRLQKTSEGVYVNGQAKPTYRPVKLPDQSAETQVDIYVQKSIPEGEGFAPFVGNTAQTNDGDQVTAAASCGAILKTHDGWKPLFADYDIGNLPITHEPHLMP